jgi:hypothetical protein
MIKLTQEQQQAYNRFIRARDVIRYSHKWIPRSDVLACVDVAGLNHPMFIQNDEYIEYQEAFQEWLKFREGVRNDNEG